MGGEKRHLLTLLLILPGSPPRWRGKVRASRLAVGDGGITPAWAGKRRPQQRHRMALQDHPRAGGEKMVISTLTICSIGSPPRGRGKAPALQPWRFSPGITPAWAGKRNFCNPGFKGHRDHPRVGGEKQTLKGTAPGRPGSPPRGRGKVKKCHCFHTLSRITPAWAGKRPCRCR